MSAAGHGVARDQPCTDGPDGGRCDDCKAAASARRQRARIAKAKREGRTIKRNNRYSNGPNGDWVERWRQGLIP